MFLSAGLIDVANLFNYADPTIPNYVPANRDNTPNNNQITDERATLGRVLFYDKNLSANNTIACASCHQQAFAFGDPNIQSTGLNGGLTGRHSMRLVNARFARERQFFWDERANTLEEQTTQPIQDHVEMGFSGQDGAPNFQNLVTKLSDIEYYQQLFLLAYGDNTITEGRIQRSLAQFIRSIQSFDAKYDEGRAQVNNNNADFPNFTAQENLGKRIFSNGANQNGAGCQACHSAPTFDITPNSRNNGVISVAGNPDGIDLTNTRSPSLRDLVNPDGTSNGPFMHDGSLNTLMDVVNHYNRIVFNPAVNPNLDNRLRGGPNGNGQNLNLTQNEKDALVAFLGTLTGNAIYTQEKWANPFDENGNLMIINGIICTDNGGDADGDGICADEDCDDNDANVGARQTADTTCDDGDANTENDVIQADGCTCAGTIITVAVCADNGGDADGDGICADEDCDDNDASIGTRQTAGISCDDGNVNTENDVIQADGCACAGTLVACANEGGDSDGDGICDDMDACPMDANNTCLETACIAPTEAIISSNGRRILIDWEDVPGAISYIIQIRFKDTNRWVATGRARASSVRLQAPNNEYEYHIQTICEDGESEFSPIYEFAVPVIGGLTSTAATDRSVTETDIIITEQIIEGEVSIYPNPARNFITIEINSNQTQPIEMTIFDSHGRLMERKQLNAENTNHSIDASIYNNGAYIIQLNDGVTQSHHKILIINN